ncbi:GNAT family N-acetyltransferase [Pseudovibrio sp. Tun.PSC04-5.I4]|uniref:GNAT family N-acetyltransferase n=1 Tax=Pseudovibrio sp. Tun.PSC04-5.I4 TaxID=1798213 RepID=UPI00088CDAEE|nr:GNAT family N-acetyltransferase [Pseudovibrio sp. Tun.PSC04-5.I4]SDQ32349.1 Acetyltransferase (GNAT) family protein [Pseudovibrio sp. Tun.PSC04-5.I4]SDR45715.1 Acetyltransferase (GNAT) family protein [Pseudovibrio sp. Tun.PSC04-5.I4]
MVELVRLNAGNKKSFDRAGFDCGEPALNIFLQETAAQAEAKNLSRTYILPAKSAPDKIVGFYTLTMKEFDTSAIPPSLLKRLPPKAPALLLARIAIDQEYQGKKLSFILISDAFQRALNVINEVGGLGLFVEAKNERVAEYYQHLGAMPLSDAPLNSLFTPKRMEDALLARSTSEVS